MEKVKKKDKFDVPSILHTEQNKDNRKSIHIDLNHHN